DRGATYPADRTSLGERVKSLMSLLHPLRSAPLFPYTTLFRSQRAWDSLMFAADGRILLARSLQAVEPDPALAQARHEAQVLSARSEEHTSELQSRENLVCRLLLEKKKQRKLHQAASGDAGRKP